MSAEEAREPGTFDQASAPYAVAEANHEAEAAASAPHMPFVKDDGGRAAAGFKGSAGDCVARSVAIASGRPYAEVYQALASGRGEQRVTRRSGKKPASARNGINVRRKWFKDYMAKLGFRWVPTMHIGQGCKVHLVAGELPPGRLIVSVSKHYTAVIDGVVHDTYDPQRSVDEHVAGPTHPDGDRDPDPGRGEWRNGHGVWRRSERCVYGYWMAGAAQ